MRSAAGAGRQSAIHQLDTLCLSSIDWGEAWQGQQEIMFRLARAGSRVVFVENTGARAPRASDLSRILRRFRDSTIGNADLRVLPEGIEVISPLGVPLPWSGWARIANRLLIARLVASRASRLRDPLLIWTFLPTPTVIDAIRACRRPESVVIYYCVSDFAAVADDPAALHRSEDDLLSLADLVFVNGTTLQARFASRHARVHIYPFGANLEQFDPDQRAQEPVDLARIPHPRAGYVGSIHRHLATDWLVAAAEKLPAVSFVLVGPFQPDVDIAVLRRCPNVHLLGPRAHASLPAYIGGFDVCLIPYRMSSYVQSVVPTKLFEYLAMGRPVVSSDLPELRAILPPGVPVSLARDLGAFVAAIKAGLDAPPSAAAMAVGRTVAERYDWGHLLEQMLGDISAVQAARTGR